MQCIDGWGGDGAGPTGGTRLRHLAAAAGKFANQTRCSGTRAQEDRVGMGWCDGGDVKMVVAVERDEDKGGECSKLVVRW
jgi:hypothetical protein